MTPEEEKDLHRLMRALVKGYALQSVKITALEQYLSGLVQGELFHRSDFARHYAALHRTLRSHLDALDSASLERLLEEIQPLLPDEDTASSPQPDPTSKGLKLVPPKKEPDK